MQINDFWGALPNISAIKKHCCRWPKPITTCSARELRWCSMEICSSTVAAEVQRRASTILTLTYGPLAVTQSSHEVTPQTQLSAMETCSRSAVHGAQCCRCSRNIAMFMPKSVYVYYCSVGNIRACCVTMRLHMPTDYNVTSKKIGYVAQRRNMPTSIWKKISLRYASTSYAHVQSLRCNALLFLRCQSHHVNIAWRVLHSTCDVFCIFQFFRLFQFRVRAVVEGLHELGKVGKVGCIWYGHVCTRHVHIAWPQTRTVCVRTRTTCP